MDHGRGASGADYLFPPKEAKASTLASEQGGTTTAAVLGRIGLRTHKVDTHFYDPNAVVLAWGTDFDEGDRSPFGDCACAEILQGGWNEDAAVDCALVPPGAEIVREDDRDWPLTREQPEIGDVPGRDPRI